MYALTLPALMASGYSTTHDAVSGGENFIDNVMKISTPDHLKLIYDDLMRSLEALQELSPNRFLPALLAAGSASEWYDVIYKLDSAANSKELRDEWDDRIHSLLNLISRQIDLVAAVERIKLSPGSKPQQESWVAALSLDPAARNSFRHGWLDISLRDSQLLGATLHVRRTWDGGSYGGAHVNFGIELDGTQISEYKERAAQLAAFDSLITPQR